MQKKKTQHSCPCEHQIKDILNASLSQMGGCQTSGDGFDWQSASGLIKKTKTTLDVTASLVSVEIWSANWLISPNFGNLCKTNNSQIKAFNKPNHLR